MDHFMGREAVRRQLLVVFLEACKQVDFSPEIWLLEIVLLDTFFASGRPAEHGQAVTVACLWIAIKLQGGFGVAVPTAEHLVSILGCDVAEIYRLAAVSCSGPKQLVAVAHVIPLPTAFPHAQVAAGASICTQTVLSDPTSTSPAGIETLRSFWDLSLIRAPGD
ncbi:hypothetical protein BCR44DRAFT_1497556 [Catenaria anguillulae PL171]|uniref:Cyclin N-terminal domain-containing protein n=1 Tax=Catenaria anguillulae PL171 TaxID=765915 RepID=A0A1Y2HTQ0_9FUNG|nr:hypothetical protein BCR44DRAFT_1497556 [Catenaria anguillulae PL171]